VQAFLEGRIGFLDIPATVEAAMMRAQSLSMAFGNDLRHDVAHIERVDAETRAQLAASGEAARRAAGTQGQAFSQA
ncbi:MAG: 1-deoxy-D-xylulose-5-phosphate reductoisomerase, partial [Asticcacaulis sp.]|nr:1-deoxy-D-xylulose-5-phosphate reductoisomerase [Asticcacaulis sp.]